MLGQAGDAFSTPHTLGSFPPSMTHARRALRDLVRETSQQRAPARCRPGDKLPASKRLSASPRRRGCELLV